MPKSCISSKFKELLQTCDKECPDASFIDGVVLGCLLCQDYSNSKLCMQYMKTLLYSVSLISHSKETRISTYANYIHILKQKVAGREEIAGEGREKRKREEKEEQKRDTGDFDGISQIKKEEITIKPNDEKVIKFDKSKRLKASDEEQSEGELDLIITNPNSCCICFQDCDSTISELECKHQFHKECFKTCIVDKLRLGRCMENCPVKQCEFKIQRDLAAKYLHSSEILVYDTYKLISDLNFKVKLSTFWCQKCRLVFTKKRSCETEVKTVHECGTECEKLRKILKYLKMCDGIKGNHSLENNEKIQLLTAALIDCKKQLQRCDVCLKWKHMFANTKSCKCQCFSNFV